LSTNGPLPTGLRRPASVSVSGEAMNPACEVSRCGKVDHDRSMRTTTLPGSGALTASSSLRA
jgi:hypothetical protein